MAIEAVSLQSPIEEKIAWAEALHSRLRHDLLQDPTVAQLLKEAGAASGGEVQVARFIRYQIGT